MILPISNRFQLLESVVYACLVHGDSPLRVNHFSLLRIDVQLFDIYRRPSLIAARNIIHVIVKLEQGVCLLQE